MAAAALEAAELDATARRAGVSLARQLDGRGSAAPGAGSPRTALARTAVIGHGRSLDDLIAAVATARAGGAAMVKLKLASADDRSRIAAVRAALPDVPLAADANGAFAGRSARELRWIDELGLAYLEQPHPADDLLASAALRAELATPIALDESVTSLAAAQTAVALSAVDVVNVKPARLGGLLVAAAVARWAADEGLGVFCGGMLELGVGRAAAAAVAALDVFGLPTDLGPSTQYVERDLTDDIGVDAAGWLQLPAGPGIGVAPDPGRLAAATVESICLRG
jgi:O-succinylbenzoate synthase